jgi:hypothetical protein
MDIMIKGGVAHFVLPNQIKIQTFGPAKSGWQV